jgi:hypothetical protein
MLKIPQEKLKSSSIHASTLTTTFSRPVTFQQPLGQFYQPVVEITDSGHRSITLTQRNSQTWLDKYVASQCFSSV